jgi:hypothetical protein
MGRRRWVGVAVHKFHTVIPATRRVAAGQRGDPSLAFPMLTGWEMDSRFRGNDEIGWVAESPVCVLSMWKAALRCATLLNRKSGKQL